MPTVTNCDSRLSPLGSSTPRAAYSASASSAAVSTMRSSTSVRSSCEPIETTACSRAWRSSPVSAEKSSAGFGATRPTLGHGAHIEGLFGWSPTGRGPAVSITHPQQQLGVSEEAETALQLQPGGGDVRDLSERLAHQSGISRHQQDPGQRAAGPQPAEPVVTLAADEDQGVPLHG